MIEGYAAQQVPGDPLESITQLRDRLSKVVELLESQAVGDGPNDEHDRTGRTQDGSIAASPMAVNPNVANP